MSTDKISEIKTLTQDRIIISTKPATKINQCLQLQINNTPNKQYFSDLLFNLFSSKLI